MRILNQWWIATNNYTRDGFLLFANSISQYAFQKYGNYGNYDRIYAGINCIITHGMIYEGYDFHATIINS